MQWDTSKIRLPQDRRVKCRHCNKKPSQYVVWAAVAWGEHTIMTWKALCHKHRKRGSVEAETLMTPAQWKQWRDLQHVMLT